jgi:hypothetical protein
MATPIGNGPVDDSLKVDSEEAQGREKVPRVESKMDTTGGDATSSSLVLPGNGGDQR